MAKVQLTWARLPQGFKNSPTLLEEAVGQDLRSFISSEADLTFLQYVDDLLLAATTKDCCWEGTCQLLELLTQAGYWVLWRKAQICQPQVKYLGFLISQGKRTLSQERKQVIQVLPVPTTKKRLHEFLGAAGFCRIWIPRCVALAKLLYQALKGPDTAPFLWEAEEERAFQAIKDHLGRALL